jgi:hypothetical protein
MPGPYCREGRHRHLPASPAKTSPNRTAFPCFTPTRGGQWAPVWAGGRRRCLRPCSPASLRPIRGPPCPSPSPARRAGARSTPPIPPPARGSPARSAAGRSPSRAPDLWLLVLIVRPKWDLAGSSGISRRSILRADQRPLPLGAKGRRGLLCPRLRSLPIGVVVTTSRLMPGETWHPGPWASVRLDRLASGGATGANREASQDAGAQVDPRGGAGLSATAAFRLRHVLRRLQSTTPTIRGRG